MPLDPNDAVEFMRIANDADEHNRQTAKQALRFRYGDQWPQYAIASRGLDRPKLTINETNTYIKKVTNAQRQQRPRGKASPVDSFADPKIAKVITGLGRHCEVNSDADNAYDTAFDFAATIGWGYWRVRADYIAEDSREQDVFIDMIDNPFAVSFDPNSKLPDGSDAEKALITDTISKEEFRREYPGAQEHGFAGTTTGTADPDWITENDIRLAEFFYVERKKAELVYLTNGMALWEDQLPDSDVLRSAGIGIQGGRQSYKRVVKWCKQSAFEILEEKELPGRWIPIVPVYWTRVIIDGKCIKRGLVYDAEGPQIMVNFWQTAITETLAMGPKAKWKMAEGQDEGHEGEWRQANLSANPVLHYKQTDVAGQQAPPPEYIQPQQPPAGFIEAAFLASQNLSRVMGVFDPAVRGGAQHKSDKTLNAEQGQSENSNFDGYDNLTRSIKHTWRIMLSYFPVIMDTQTVRRIIGEDGREEMVTLNERTTAQDETGQAIEKVLNDITVGTYDVVMQTGPGYETRRQEGVAAKLELLSTPLGEKIAQVGDDLIVREMDFHGADTLADRLAAANPLAQIDDKSDIPPNAQMMIKSLQAQLQQAGQQIQAMGQELKYKGELEKFKQGEETKRELMRTTTRAHDSTLRSAAQEHDTEMRALSGQHEEEIKGLVQLLIHHLDTKRLEQTAEREEKESESKANEATPALE